MSRANYCPKTYCPARKAFTPSCYTNQSPEKSRQTSLRYLTDTPIQSIVLRLFGGCRRRRNGPRRRHTRHPVEHVVRGSERVKRRPPDSLSQGASAEECNYNHARHDYRLPFDEVAGSFAEVPFGRIRCARGARWGGEELTNYSK